MCASVTRSTSACHEPEGAKSRIVFRAVMEMKDGSSLGRFIDVRCAASAAIERC